MQSATRLSAIERRLASRKPAIDPEDRERYRWYADSCPCKLAPGECREHPRARAAQRPPAGGWRYWFACSGRGWGKTRCGAEWVRHLVESGKARRIALVAPTAFDARSVMVEGESGLLSVCPPWNRPKYEPSRCKLTWPNGAIATTYSAEEPERLRGPQHDAAWCDEVGAWTRHQAFDMLLLGLRLGSDPRVCLTSTPRATVLVKRVIADPETAKTGGPTFENRRHLAEPWFDQVIGQYEGTRLGRQELYGELLSIVDGAWFPRFDRLVHVDPRAELIPELPARIAIDAGVSRCTGAIYYQLVESGADRREFRVFGDYYAEDLTSDQNAAAILARSMELGVRQLDRVRIDPAATARTGIGPASYTEYEKAFGRRQLERWPLHQVVDGLNSLELLLEHRQLVVHPRAAHLIAAFEQYRRAQRAGEWLDAPADPQHPAEDLMDAIRGAVRDAYPEGFKLPPRLYTVPTRTVFG